MKYFPTLLVSIAVAFLTSCSNNSTKENTSEFGKVSKLKEYPGTNFLPTLESPVDAKKNGVYAASLVFAWKEIEKKLASPITKIESAELRRLYECRSFNDVLNADEYETEVRVEKPNITAKAYFKKLLPLKEPMIRNTEPLQAFNTEVENFGFWGYHVSAIILYYNSDDDFAIKLFPKDKAHEIILIKTPFANKIVLGKEVEKFHQRVSIFKENLTATNEWKMFLDAEDEARIPLMKFNIETNYPTIETTGFLAGETPWKLTTVYQRTAFILNEEGAKVESEAEVNVSSAEEEPEPVDKRKPKKLFFNKPFMVLLKRTNNPNPYFAAYIANAELLVKK